MVEGGVVKAADKTELTECWKVTWKTPYIMRLAFSAGTGGLLFEQHVLDAAIAFRLKNNQSVGTNNLESQQKEALILSLNS
ncbi:inositol transporter 4-like [Populus alba x Populus x berolinensis]|nr:inositol transporter 4-like [Populus alba x Populus x berolinensis]